MMGATLLAALVGFCGCADSGSTRVGGGKGQPASNTSAVQAGPDTEWTDQQGFRFGFRVDKALTSPTNSAGQAAPPGQHYVKLIADVTNRQDDRPATLHGYAFYVYPQETPDGTGCGQVSEGRWFCFQGDPYQPAVASRLDVVDPSQGVLTTVDVQPGQTQQLELVSEAPLRDQFATGPLRLKVQDGLNGSGAALEQNVP